MGKNVLPSYILSDYEVHEWRHALSILEVDYPAELADIVNILGQFRLCESWLTVGGGRKSKVAEALDKGFYALGWVEKKFATSIHVDAAVYNSPTHKVDCYKNKVGIEIEWNNKDPFYDRDLNNFRLLFELRVISAGVIITRCDHLQVIFNALGRGDSYGESTTHMSKLLPKIEGGGAGGCPIVVFGISNLLYDKTC